MKTLKTSQQNNYEPATNQHDQEIPKKEIYLQKKDKNY